MCKHWESSAALPKRGSSGLGMLDARHGRVLFGRDCSGAVTLNSKGLGRLLQWDWCRIQRSEQRERAGGLLPRRRETGCCGRAGSSLWHCGIWEPCHLLAQLIPWWHHEQDRKLKTCELQENSVMPLVYLKGSKKSCFQCLRKLNWWLPLRASLELQTWLGKLGYNQEEIRVSPKQKQGEVCGCRRINRRQR